MKSVTILKVVPVCLVFNSFLSQHLKGTIFEFYIQTTMYPNFSLDFLNCGNSFT